MALLSGALHGAADHVSERVYADEVGHGPQQVHEYTHTRIQSEEQLEEEKRWLTEFLQHHLRVRNEIFRYPLSQQRMEAIDRGEFVPEAFVSASAH